MKVVMGASVEIVIVYRLSSDGRFFPCLFSNDSFSIKEMGVKGAYKRAVVNKPEVGIKSQNRFHSLGG